jgi:hypothetical protein
MTGFEPVAFALQRRCSPAELHPRETQVGLTGLEPVTPVLSGLCSNQLSYRPMRIGPQQLRSDRKKDKNLPPPRHRGGKEILVEHQSARERLDLSSLL